MSNESQIKEFICQNAQLFWFVPDTAKKDISEECLVETVLNYGRMDSIIRLIQLMGIDRVAQIFFESIGRSDRRKHNYHELTVNYFTLLFRRYAPRYSD